MKLSAFFTSIALAAALQATADTGPTLQSSGPNDDEYTVEIGQFTKIKVYDNVNVIYRCVPDTTGIATYHGSHDFDNAFIFTNDGGTLKIQVSTEDVGKPDLPTVYLYSDFLTEVTNSSEFHMQIQNPAPCPKFEVEEIGNGSVSVTGLKATEVKAKITTGMGNIALSGKCEKALFQLVGTGVIQADNLLAQDVECKIMGSGTIGCDAAVKLKTRGIGSTKIYYRGNPVIDKKGGGKLIPLE